MLNKNACLKLFVVCISVMVLLQSCQSPHYYRPKPHEPVLLTHRGQSKVNLVSDNNLDAFSAAYSPKKNLGFAAGLGVLREAKDAGERYFNPYLSAGYYTKVSKNTLFETYSGIGLYNYKNKNTDVTLKKLCSIITLCNLLLQSSKKTLK